LDDHCTDFAQSPANGKPKCEPTGLGQISISQL